MDFPSDEQLMDGENALEGTLVGEDWPEGHRAGFVCLVGRPNTGKSTLTNALVGQKVAITSVRPQTTRHTIRGILNREDSQVVLVDTPGMHRPRTLLGQRLNDLVRETLWDVDAVVMCFPADQAIGPGDRYLVEQLEDLRKPRIAVITKIDKVSKNTVLEQLTAVSKLCDWAEIVPVSAVRSERVETLAELLAQRMPLSPPLYPRGEITDEPTEKYIAELVREAALEGVRQELPHSFAAVVEEMVEAEKPEGAPETWKPTLIVRVHCYVERPSQKDIIIGRGGNRLRVVGTRARKGIEELLGRKIYLDLHVKVAKDWQQDPKQLGKLGF